VLACIDAASKSPEMVLKCRLYKDGLVASAGAAGTSFVLLIWWVVGTIECQTGNV